MKLLKYTEHYFLIFFLSLCYHSAFSQEIVVNEYYNESSQNDEWTELVVIKDNLDLSDWYLGDNNAGTSNWQPKIKFKNHLLWKNLRAGTIIQIDHASNLSNCNDATDTDKSDGFIRVCCRNATYFEGGSTTTLFLADDGDFVQIVDPTGKMVHGIGHDDDPGTSVVGGTCFTTSSNWTNTTTAKAATRPCGNFTYYKYAMASPTSLKMIAGTTSDFSSGIQTSTSNPFIDTTDTPFEGIGNGGFNNQWLIELRAPEMESQNICQSKSSDGTISFSWLPATDAFPQDNTIGYIVVRNTTGDFGTPEQGKQYVLNATFGAGPQVVNVVKVITSSLITTFSENPGQGTFYYRVFPFRYINTPSFEHPTRGRAYNTTNFVKVNADIAPNVEVTNDTLCGPGIAVLIANFGPAPNPGSINWYTSPTGGNPILTNSDTLRTTISQSKSFWVQMESSQACSATRFEVKAILRPLICEYFAADSVCEGTPAYLVGVAKPGISYQWNLINPPAGVTSTKPDSIAFEINVPSFPVKRWIYFRVRAISDEGCQSAFVKDSLFTVPFDPKIVSDPAEPTAGDSVKYSIANSFQNFWVNQWTVINGIILEENPINLNVKAINDSIKVSASISTVTPTDGRFRKVNRELNLKVKPIEAPLKIINNLITTNSDLRNNSLDFDRREVKNLEIYDRWGKKIHTSSVYKNDWKPGSKDIGIYFYSAEVKEPGAGTFEVKTGWVQVAE